MDEKFVTGRRIRTNRVAGYLYEGIGPGPHPGVLVLHGAGGAGGYERQYAALLAEHGYTVLCVEYFGAPGIRENLASVPLEAFERAGNWLTDHPDVAGDRVGVAGFSRGGEAALLAGAHFDVVGAVIAYVPSGLVFPAPSWMDGIGENEPAWTLGGDPLPFIPVDEYVTDADGIEAPLGGDEPRPPMLAHERAPAAIRERATIPVENIAGPVLLVSGDEDRVWPSTRFAGLAAERLERHDHSWPVEHRSYPAAGHAIRVPYRFESDDPPDETHWLGGTSEANAAAAADAWLATLQCLDRTLGQGSTR